MQTLPANGQAQPLPAKWVIKRTPENAEMVNKWANKQHHNAEYADHKGWVHSEPVDHESPSPLVLYGCRYTGFVEITDSQFKAMVEGESKPRRLVDIDYLVEQVKIDDPIQRVKAIHAILVWAGEEEMADEYKARHPDIWPVDYAAIVLEKAVLMTEEMDKEDVTWYKPFEEVRNAVRNYLTNQK